MISISVIGAGLDKLPTGGCTVVEDIGTGSPPSVDVRDKSAVTSTGNVPVLATEIVPDQVALTRGFSPVGSVVVKIEASSIS